MAEAVYGHSKPKSATAMAIVAIHVAPPLVVHDRKAKMTAIRFSDICLITDKQQQLDSV